MSEFDELFSDAFQSLAVTHGEADDVVYRFRAGGTRTISNAIVDRNPPEERDEFGNIVTPLLTVTLIHDSTLGVLHSEIDAGDQIDVVVVKGQAPKTRTVSKIVNPDQGVIVLEVV